MAKHWLGVTPIVCDFCEEDVKTVFVDGRTNAGWAHMCLHCHDSRGFGLGVGKGQKYRKQEDGRWLKVEG